jgi:polysaccharide pyruvyl transferase WcaK-like protein
MQANHPGHSGQLVDQPISTIDDLLTQLSKTDFVVASRYHSVLLAHLLSKPTIALSYEEKVDSLVEAMGQEAYCLPIDQFEVDTLVKRFSELEANAEAIRAVIAKRTREFRAQLEEQYERLFNPGGLSNHQ